MNKNMFKAALAQQGYTQKKLAAEMNMTDSTMIRKVKNSSFTISEAERISTILHIQNPSELFFEQNGTCQVPR